MVLTALLVATGVIFFMAPLPSPLLQKEPTQKIIIKNVNVIDVLNGITKQNMQVVIVGGIVSSIEDTQTVTNTNSALVIDGTDRFLIPGLWDMHSHLAFNEAPQLNLPLFFANGVLHVRDMQGIMDIVDDRKRWANSVNSHEMLGPRIIGYANHIVGDNYDQRKVEKVVQKSLEDPLSFVKIYSQIKEDRFLKLAELANKHNVQLAGHYPLSMDPVRAANAGQRSFEHAHLLIDNSSSLAQTIRQHYEEKYTDEVVVSTPKPESTDILRSFNQAQFDRLIESLIKNDTYLVPTHITKRYEAYSDDESLLSDDRLKYIPYLVRNLWLDDAKGMAEYDKEELEEYYLRGLALTGLAFQRGVKILAGTDTYDPFSFPGFSLHEELAQLSKAGFSNADVLAAATILPATYFDKQHMMGSVDVGKQADFLLLKKNPLDDITYTQTIEKIIFDGAVYDEEDIKHHKKYVEENVSGFTGISISIKMLVSMFQDNNAEARNADYQ